MCVCEWMHAFWFLCLTILPYIHINKILRERLCVCVLVMLFFLWLFSAGGVVVVDFFRWFLYVPFPDFSVCICMYILARCWFFLHWLCVYLCFNFGRVCLFFIPFCSIYFVIWTRILCACVSSCICTKTFGTELDCYKFNVPVNKICFCSVENKRNRTHRNEGKKHFHQTETAWKCQGVRISNWKQQQKSRDATLRSTRQTHFHKWKPESGFSFSYIIKRIQ